MAAYRTSSFSIIVPLENERDKYMLVHGYTGAMDIVNGEVVDFLNNINKNGR